MSDAESTFCSDAARERCDPLAGSAAPTRRWLLIEHPGPWQIDALAGSGIDAGVRSQLQAAALAGGARILLVRRPGRRRSDSRDGARSWAVIDHRLAAAPIWGRWRQDDDLLAAATALDPESAAELAEPSSSPGGSAPAEVLLVCAHGRHDTCCAVRGRPVAAALAERWPEQTWECSHVGGDRFAANLVMLPDGLYYGYLDPDSAVRVVEGHLRGEVEATYLRGVSTQPPVAQVAVVAALARWGPAGPRDLRLRALHRGDGDRWRVELAGSGDRVPGRVVATVAPAPRSPALLTCRALREATAPTYEVVDLRVD